ncbi:hypothetical protein RN001_000131 [Aquatica leii]|uniref:Uncharacterized protein n=1 Tax=Aquatica leii TaxID=1421715 RepID=A0AAN7SSE0_9COLE|nr:hypothetical protein RN001_000131 [Aquatica leii]
MKNLEVLCVLTFAITFATTSPINQEKDPKAESGKDVPKGKSLIIAEPLYKPHDLEIVPEYQNEPVINYYHVDGLGKRGVVVYPTGNPSDMEVAESNIVFRPLFAYRKQMEKRRRIYLEERRDREAQTQNKRGYYYYYGYPKYYQNSQFEHVS